MMDEPRLYRSGDGIILECDGEKWLSDVLMASPNGRSLIVTFRGAVGGHLGSMALLYESGGVYRSIINGIEAKIRPLPPDWMG